ncbi:MAG: sulfite exporter TauE/SafE family protein [Candidatus Aureabacteria bacterium]|nr:sulfite exporter TauE/SafE family protein [Candidatus Auribacterota bacterium]
MEQEINVTYFLAFFYGFLSFLSPCIFPLIPSYVSFMTGTSIDQLSSSGNRLKNLLAIVFSSALFVLGFSLVFISLGASASLIGKSFFGAKRTIEIIGGLLLIALGIHMSGLANIPFLNFEKKIHLGKKPFGLLGSFVLGLVFAAGWTPCVGPLAATVITFASQTKNVYQAALLMLIFSLGIGLPFMIVSVGLQSFLQFSSFLKKHLGKIQAASGVFILLTGILFISGKFELFTSFITNLFY